MPATSQQQQKLFGLALSVKRGDTPRSEVSDEVLQIVDTMSEKKIEDFAKTSHKGLPTKVEAFIRGMVRKTFRTKVLGEASRRSTDFFEDGKYGKELNKLFGGKFDGNKFDKFVDAIDKKATDVQFERILNFMGGQIGMNIRSYDNKPMQVFIDDLKKEVEKLYKIHNESVNETFIPKVGTIDDYKLKDLLMKNPKVNAILGDGETAFMKKSDVVVIGHQSKRFNTIFTDGTQEFEIDMKVGKLVKPLSKARKEIVDYFSKKKSESVTEEVEQLDEKLIVYSNRAPYGQVVFIAGGAGSGKGYAVSNFLDSSSFKVRDVDEMKKQLQKLNTIGKLSIQQIIDRFGKNIRPADLEGIKKIQSDGFDLKTMDLKKPDHVYALHILVKAMDIKDQTLANMLGAAKNPEALPNIMFDITAKEIADITDVLPQLLAVGYKPNNIHLAWVLANYQVAIKSNQERDRVVPADILLKTHIGAGNTIWGMVTKALPKDMNGRVDVILNNRENTIPFTEKDEKTPIKVQAKGQDKPEIIVKSFLSLPVKKQGGGILPEALWKDLLFKWIKDNGPKELTANM